MAGQTARLTIAVCAFNEEANIGGLLRALVTEPWPEPPEIVVVSSASTDRTDTIVEAFAAQHDNVRLVREEQRRGKSFAVNTALHESSGDVIALVDADCRPATGALQAALALLEVPEAGGAGTRNVPVNGEAGLVARAGAVMWELHHRVCLEAPVLGGDVVFFRRVFKAIDVTLGVNDDFLIEAELRSRGYRIEYAATAVTYMRVPETAADFIRQRRRIHNGFMREARSGPTRKNTQSPGRVLRHAFRVVRERPSVLPALLTLMALDTWSRLLAYADLRFGWQRHEAWQPASSTKAPIPEAPPRTGEG